MPAAASCGLAQYTKGGVKRDPVSGHGSCYTLLVIVWQPSQGQKYRTCGNNFGDEFSNTPA